MKLAVMQPYFLPYIGYFQMINAVDKFVFYDDVTYIKKGWINRNRVKGGTIFTIPLKNQSQNRLIRDTEVLWSSRFISKFLKTIHQTYSKSPYFSEVFSIVEDIINSQPNTISELAIDSVMKFSDYIGIDTEFKVSSEEEYLKGEDKVINLINICNHFISFSIKDHSHWEDRSFESVYQELITIKGVGPWTAEMFGMFYLLEKDIFPIKDIGIIRAMNQIYGDGNILSKNQIIEISEQWKPYRSVACWFLWKSIDSEDVQY